MTMTEKLYETVRDFPEPIIAELLDFADFLRVRKLHIPASESAELLIDLRGGLENSTTFADDPLAIQERLRNDWNKISPGYQFHSRHPEIKPSCVGRRVSTPGARL